MAVVIRDFMLKLGFDSSEVDRGLGQIERSLKSIAQAQNRVVNSQLSAEDRVARVRRNTENQMRQSQQQRLRNEANTLIRNAQLQQRLDNARNDALLRAARLRNQATSIRGASPSTASVIGGINNDIGSVLGRLRTADTPQQVRELNRELTQLRDRLTQAQRAQRQLNRNLGIGARAANGFRDSLNNLGRSYVSVFAAIAGGAAAVQTGQSLIQLQAGLLAASDGADEARSNFEFLRAESLRLGTDLVQTTRGFQQFGVAANAAGFSTEETRSLFQQVSQAAVSFGLSTDDTSGVFRAFAQTLSRGVVSMEELN